MTLTWGVTLATHIVSITAPAGSKPFTADMVGRIYELLLPGQSEYLFAAGEEQWSLPVRVTGKGTTTIPTSSDRDVVVNLLTNDTFVGTLVLQRSIGEPGNWEFVQNVAADVTFNDDLDDEIIYYRVGIPDGNYTGGARELTIFNARGSSTARMQVTTFTASNVLSGTSLNMYPGLAGTSTVDWRSGGWSEKDRFPTAVALHEARMWWSGRNKICGTTVDQYENFDDDPALELGDSGPMTRTIGRGPVDTINWMAPLTRLILGTQGSEFALRASSLDELVTPTNFNLKPVSTNGSGAVPAAIVDDEVLFTHRNNLAVYSLGPAADGVSDYGAVEISLLVPEIGSPGITRMAVQRKPDTRIHCIRSDGSVALAVYSKLENVKCWITLDMAAGYEVVDATVLPSATTGEDEVYYVVRDTTVSPPVYMHARWALESECQGGLLNKQADLFVAHSGAAITELDVPHIPNGTELVIWADGEDRGTAVVAGGEVQLGGSYTKVVAGLPYEALFKGTSLQQTLPELFQKSRVSHLGLRLYNTHAKGLQYGPDFDNLDELPDIENEEAVDPNKVWDYYDQEAFEFNGKWSTNNRICLRAAAPRPCTVLAFVADLEIYGK